MFKNLKAINYKKKVIEFSFAPKVDYKLHTAKVLCWSISRVLFVSMPKGNYQFKTCMHKVALISIS